MSHDAGRTILCIDDDRGALDYHKALLERSGFEVLTAASGRQGLQIAEVQPIAVVVVDYQMPEMCGDEVAAAIKRVKPKVPVILVSAHDEIPEEALSIVDAFICKGEADHHLLPAIMRFTEMAGQRSKKGQRLEDQIVSS